MKSKRSTPSDPKAKHKLILFICSALFVILTHPSQAVGFLSLNNWKIVVVVYFLSTLSLLFCFAQQSNKITARTTPKSSPLISVIGLIAIFAVFGIPAVQGIADLFNTPVTTTSTCHANRLFGRQIISFHLLLSSGERLIISGTSFTHLTGVYLPKSSSWIPCYRPVTVTYLPNSRVALDIK